MVGLVVVGDNNKKNGQYLICPVCGKEFYRKKYLIDHAKDKNNMTCSRECCYILRKTLYRASGNPQYGIKGDENASWNGGIRNQANGYKFVTSTTHPFRNKYNLIPEYVLVAEQYLLTEENSIEINGVKYLNPNCVVHHKDFNKKNNDPSNLYVFPNKTQHILYHNLYRTKTFTVDEFNAYYKDKYVNKILNYDWLYSAYVYYDLSINQISENFDIPYKSIEYQVKIFDLAPIKTETQKQRIKQIIDELECLGSSGK